MEEKDKNKLIEKRVFIIENLIVNTKFTSFLLQKKVLSAEDLEEFKNLVNHKQSSLLLSILPKRGPHAYKYFKEALDNTEQRHIHEHLDDTLPAKSSTGRDALTEKPIHDYQKRSTEEDRAIEQIIKHQKVVLTGPPGAGKTQLARRLSNILSQKWPKELLPDGIHPRDIICATIDGKGETQLIHSLLETINLIENRLKINISIAKSQNSKRYIQDLFTAIFQEFSCTSNNFLILKIDDLTDTLSHISKISGNIIVLVTTNNETLYTNCVVPVPGFTNEEAVRYFKVDYDSSESNLNIEKLADAVDNLPLGMAVSKSYIKETKCTITSLVDIIKSVEGREIFRKKEPKLEHVYGNGLISTWIVVIQERLMKLLNESMPDNLGYLILSAAMFLDTSSISEKVLEILMSAIETDQILHGKLKKPTTPLQKKPYINELIAALRKTSIAVITCDLESEEKNRTLHFHCTLRDAWLSLLHEKKQYEDSLLLCFKAIVGHCDVDTRFSNNFMSYYYTLHHMEAALKHVDKQNNEMSLHLAVLFAITHGIAGHMFMYLDQPYKAAEILDEGIKQFFLHILPVVFEEFQEQIQPHTRSYAVRASQKLYELIDQNTSKDARKIFAESYMLHKSHNTHLVKRWQEKCRWLNTTHQHKLQDNCITNALQTTFVEKELALSTEKFSQFFLTEVIALLFFKRGRIYHYTDKETIDGETRAGYKQHLEVAYALTQLVEKKHGVKLYLSILCQRNGLLYIEMESKNKSSTEFCHDIQSVFKSFEAMYENKKNYYRFGVQEMTAGDVYNDAVCIREMTNCLSILYNRLPESEKKKALEKWSTYNKKLKEKIEKLKEKNLLKGLHRPQSFTNMLAKFNLACGHIEDACEILTQNVEDILRTGRAPYTLTHSVLMLVECKCQKRKFSEATDIKKQFEEYIDKVYSKDPKNNRDSQVMKEKHSKTSKQLESKITAGMKRRQEYSLEHRSKKQKLAV